MRSDKVSLAGRCMHQPRDLVTVLQETHAWMAVMQSMSDGMSTSVSRSLKNLQDEILFHAIRAKNDQLEQLIYEPPLNELVI